MAEKLRCSKCGAILDKVILSYGTRTWNEELKAYVHTEGDDEGDWACSECGETLVETRFYPPVSKYEGREP